MGLGSNDAAMAGSAFNTDTAMLTKKAFEMITHTG